jgi:hypothetical protein
VPVEEAEPAGAAVVARELESLIAPQEPARAAPQVEDRAEPHAAPGEGDTVEVTGREIATRGAKADGGAEEPPAPLPALEAARSAGSGRGREGQHTPADKAARRDSGAGPAAQRKEEGDAPARPLKPQIYTPPHAPDDPGTDAGDDSDPAAPLRPFRA